MEPILIIIIILALLTLGYITIYNKIQDYVTKIEKAENIIDTDLRGKYDLLIKINTYFTNLEDKNQKDYLKDLKDLKGKDIPNFELERKLMDAEGILLDIYNDKSENQENKELQVLLKELKEKNQKLLSSINYYNNYASQMNAYIRKIPQNLVAILSHKKEKEFFDKKESKKITSSHWLFFLYLKWFNFYRSFLTK